MSPRGADRSPARTPTPGRRPEDAPAPTRAPAGRRHQTIDDRLRATNHLPNAERAAILAAGLDGDDLDAAVELEAERIFGHVENLGPGDTWAYALEQANRRIRGT